MHLDDLRTQALPVFLQAMALSLGLIVAIGAQNAFVLRQGLLRAHVASVALFCAAADALLIAAGVLGMAQALGRSPGLARALAVAGALFLAAYGWRALQRARQPQRLQAAAGGAGLGRAAVLAQAAAFTLLNPHVYLDTVLLVGSIGAQQPAVLRGWFIAGACAASLGWFTLLGYGARWLAPWFSRPRAWQVLDGLIGVTMWVLAAWLLRLALAGPGADAPAPARLTTNPTATALLGRPTQQALALRSRMQSGLHLARIQEPDTPCSPFNSA